MSIMDTGLIRHGLIEYTHKNMFGDQVTEIVEVRIYAKGFGFDLVRFPGITEPLFRKVGSYNSEKIDGYADTYADDSPNNWGLNISEERIPAKDLSYYTDRWGPFLTYGGVQSMLQNVLRARIISEVWYENT